jgi:hypothetical protein
VHQIGVPYNFGALGYSPGDGVGNLVPLAMDPNVSIHEAKTMSCTLRPGRRARLGHSIVDEPVPFGQHTTEGQSTARGRDTLAT